MAGPGDDAQGGTPDRAEDPVEQPVEQPAEHPAARPASRPVVALVAALTTALAAVGIAGLVVGRPASRPGCVTGPAGAATLGTLLAARDRTLLRPGAPSALAGTAATLRDRLDGLPVTAWSSRVVTAEGAGDAVRGLAAVRYRLAGDTVDTVRDRAVGATRAGGCWTLRTDEPAPGAVPDVWDLGPVRVERTAQAVVVASAALDAGAVHALAADVSRAAGTVAAVWPPGPRRPVVVLAPRTPDDAAAVAATPRPALVGLAAVTFGPPSPGAAGPSAFGDARVLVVPDGFGALTADGRRFVLAHELTHVATDAVARAAVPAWFQECFADVVGWSALGLDEARVDALVGDDLRAARLASLPARLPDRAGFDPRRGSPATAYALADAACLALGDGPDAARLAAVYRKAADAGPADTGPAGAPSSGPATTSPSATSSAAGTVPDTAVLAAAGTDERRLVAAWHRRILALAGPIPGSTP